MVDTAESTGSWRTAAAGDAGLARTVARTVAVGLAVGAVVGMGTFSYTIPAAMPDVVPEWVPLAFVAAAGVYPHLFASSLRQSMGMALVGLGAGFAVTIGAWVAPLWILPVPPVARDIFLPFMSGRAFSSVVLVVPIAYFGTYLGMVFVDGLLFE